MKMTKHREMLMASGLATTPDASGRYEVTVEISEAGWADLSRLQLLAVDRAEQTHSKEIDVLPLTLVEGIRIHNTQELIRGQGSRIGAPAGVFSPYRQYGPIQLGKWWLEGGNIVSIVLRTHLDKPDAAPDLAYSAAFPFAPDNHREYQAPADLDDRSRAYVASAISPYPSEDASDDTLEIRFDQDGVVDLDSLQLLVEPHPEADREDLGVSTTAIESIELPTRQELILGGSATDSMPRAAPAAIFGSLGRRFNWVNFGYLDVSTNNTLRVRVRSLISESGDSGHSSIGLQFYPASRPGRRHGAQG